MSKKLAGVIYYTSDLNVSFKLTPSDYIPVVSKSIKRICNGIKKDYNNKNNIHRKKYNYSLIEMLRKIEPNVPKEEIPEFLDLLDYVFDCINNRPNFDTSLMVKNYTCMERVVSLYYKEGTEEFNSVMFVYDTATRWLDYQRANCLDNVVIKPYIFLSIRLIESTIYQFKNFYYSRKNIKFITSYSPIKDLLISSGFPADEIYMFNCSYKGLERTEHLVFMDIPFKLGRVMNELIGFLLQGVNIYTIRPEVNVKNSLLDLRYNLIDKFDLEIRKHLGIPNNTIPTSSDMVLFPSDVPSDYLVTTVADEIKAIFK